jgi:NADH-quinone oxidoreductase subunit G
MVELEIDGRKVEVPEGSMVMDAAHKLDVYVPHFCYHPKLSIAANCRMCLVDVEKAPKPLPACATPVAQGMIVRTQSERARQAQQGVMELLLINHPLDCPICDQGGECQLQDLAVGYGASTSRYEEEKRVVFHKNAGPLIAMEEMTRCIHCTRCVRFGQEVAGIMELGMANRGEHSEITSFLEGSVDSELSGNMIDLCPVGALTSKPFRYAARGWELQRRASVSPHDSLGANLVMQVKNNRVLRVVAQTNEAVNECWIADRDRFSYEGLNAADRLASPMIREDDGWREVDWPTALDFVARALQRVLDVDGPAGIGALASSASTVEELFLLNKLVRALGSDNIDFRVRRSDFSAADAVPSLGLALADVAQLQGALVVGSTLRKDHPLLASKLRRAAKAGAQVAVLHAAADELLMPLASQIAAAPAAWLRELGGIAAAVADAKSVARPASLAALQPGDAQRAAAAALLQGERKVVWLGNAALRHPQAGSLEQLARWIAAQTGAAFGHLVEGANEVGAHLLGAKPRNGGRHAAQMLAEPPAALLLLNLEPALDLPGSLREVPMAIAFSAFRPADDSSLKVVLPIAPFSENAGSLINAEGRVQTFGPVVGPIGQSRAAWKVLRVLADQLGLAGFDYDTVESVRDAALAGVEIAAELARPVAAELPATIDFGAPLAAGALERYADVPIYAVDGVVRRARALQATRDARDAGSAGIGASTWERLGLQPGDRVRVQQGDAAVELPARLDATLADGVVRVACALSATAPLPQLFGAVSVQKV